MSNEPLAHRLAAILAADVAGYSRLMQTDDRATVHALDAARRIFREEIEAGQGRVIDMVGDAVLAVFDTAIGAVTAALSVQRALAASVEGTPAERQMRFRIGVHLGDIIQKSDGTIYGDGVNIAARLEALAEPGGISVSEPVRSVVRGKIDATFTDQGEHHVKNISEPLRVHRVTRGAAPSVRSSMSVAATMAASASLADLPLPDRPSIAVLPFTNLSGDPEQEFFADGMTEDILTELARISGLLVIARNSTFVFKKQAVDVQTIGRKFGVRHVLEGSVRKSGGRVRITAQLIETATSGHVWAERFDRDLEDIFAVQDEVTAHIVEALKIKLTGQEVEKKPRPKASLEAYHLVMLARANYYRFTLDASRDARAQLRRAVELAPEFAHAHAWLGHVHAIAHVNNWDESEPHVQIAQTSVQTALELNPREPQAHMTLVVLAMFTHDLEKALRVAHESIELSPSDSRAYVGLASVLDFMGEHDAAIAQFEIARRLDPGTAQVIHLIGRAHFGAGRYAEAEACFRERLAREPHSDMSRAYLASICGTQGRLEEARRWWAELLEVNPKFCVRFVRDTLPYRDSTWFDRFESGLRTADLLTRN